MDRQTSTGHGRRGSIAACLVAANLLIGPAAFAAPPAAPAVSVNAGLKQLHFTWSRVAQTQRYELWFRANTGAAWVKYKDLAVGAPADPSSASGVGGDQSDTSQPFRGAVWLY